MAAEKAALRVLFAAVSLLLFSLLATPVSGAENASVESVNLGKLLERAQEEGLITEKTSNQLLLLAANLTNSEFPSQLSILQQKGRKEREKLSEEGEFITSGETKQNFLMKFYNHLTLLNILYFGGALLVMGAYSLFMTLAYEKCSYVWLSGIMLVQVVAFGVAGITTWQKSEEFQLVGGLLCTVSTSMVPFFVYNMQRGLGMWPQHDRDVFIGFRTWIRPCWVIMELATILCGFGYFNVVRFPFLLFPVSFCLWFLSMDLAPLYPHRRGLDFFEIRRRISIAFGMGMMLFGYLLELRLGSEPDLSFWVYLFGLMTFTGALQFSFPLDDLSGSVLLLINMGLILIGSHLNRTTFHVFGSLEIIVYTVAYFSTTIKMSNSFSLWILKALCAAALFSQALQREGNFEVLCALVCLAAFNFNSIAFLGSGGELNAIFLLLTNLGFVAAAGAFSRPLDLWLFTLPDSLLPISLLCSLMVAIFHVTILIKYLPSDPSSLGVRSYVYLAYRIVASLAISFAFVFLRQPSFAWIGGLGILVVAVALSSTLRREITGSVSRGHYERSITQITSIYLTLLLGITFSIYLESNVFYLISCLFMLFFTLSLMNNWKRFGCVLSVFLILLSVALQSKFLITIGVIYLFFYLSYLAYDVFKNSLLFPLALIGIGIGLIFSGIMYQRHEADLHSLFQGLIPDSIQSLTAQTVSTLWEEGGKFDWYHHIEKATFSLSDFVQAPYRWVLWTGAMTFALLHGSPLYVSWLCAGGIVALVSTYILLEVRESHKEHLDSKVQVTSLTFELSNDHAHESHGMIIQVRGKKPSGLEKPEHIALDVTGDGFWRTVSSVYGEFPASMARSMFLPYRLTPHLINITNFNKGSNVFSASIQLATGHRGTKRAKHATLKNAVSKLAYHKSNMSCVVLYSNSWYKPWSRLCVKSVPLTDIKRQLHSD